MKKRKNQLIWSLVNMFNILSRPFWELCIFQNFEIVETKWDALEIGRIVPVKSSEVFKKSTSPMVT